jgi:hypothetical protein
MLRLTALGGALLTLTAPGCGGGGGNNNNDRATEIFERLESGDRRTDDGRYFDLYDIRARRDGRAFIEMRSSSVDAVLVVFDDRGNIIAENDEINDDINDDITDARVQFDVRRGEVYTVAASSYDPDERGTYSLIFSSELENVTSRSTAPSPPRTGVGAALDKPRATSSPKPARR